MPLLPPDRPRLMLPLPETLSLRFICGGLAVLAVDDPQLSAGYLLGCFAGFFIYGWVIRWIAAREA